MDAGSLATLEDELVQVAELRAMHARLLALLKGDDDDGAVYVAICACRSALRIALAQAARTRASMETV